jgi:hypothetical protein
LEEEKRNKTLNKAQRWELFRVKRAETIKNYCNAKKIQKLAEAINLHVVAR